MIMMFSDIISIHMNGILLHFRAPFKGVSRILSGDYMLLQKSSVSISTIHDPYMNDHFKYLSLSHYEGVSHGGFF